MIARSCIETEPTSDTLRPLVVALHSWWDTLAAEHTSRLAEPDCDTKDFDDILKAQAVPPVDMFCTVWAELVAIQCHHVTYDACPLKLPHGAACLKKVQRATEDPNAPWHCQRCNKDVLTPLVRYLPRSQWRDRAGKLLWATMAANVAEEVLNMEAQDFAALSATEQARRIVTACRDHLYERQVRLHVTDTHVTVLSARPAGWLSAKGPDVPR